MRSLETARYSSVPQVEMVLH